MQDRFIIQFEEEGLVIRKTVTKGIYNIITKIINNPSFCAFVEDLEKDHEDPEFLTHMFEDDE